VRFSVALLAAFAGLALAGCHRGQIRLPTAAGAEGHTWRNPVDLEIYRAPARALLYTVEPPVGYAEARHRPGRSLAIALRLNWNAAVRPLSDAFERLAMEHNAAEIALSDFTDRERNLGFVLDALRPLRARFDGLLAEYDDLMSATEPDSPDQYSATNAIRARARQINLEAAECVAAVCCPESPQHDPDAVHPQPVRP